MAGHAQVDLDARPIVEIDEEVFPTPPEADDAAAREHGGGLIKGHLAEHAREIADYERTDRPPDEMRFQGAANCLDLGEFWHTQTGERDCERVAAMVARRFTDVSGTGVSNVDECIFCRIVRGDFGTELVAENDGAIAFRDLDPKAPSHVLVVPRSHVASLNDLGDGDAKLAGELLSLAKEVAVREGIADSGYRVLTNTGTDAGQTVFHLHFHVMGGARLSAGLG
jgi:histidine triad (HIT) family protein